MKDIIEKIMCDYFVEVPLKYKYRIRKQISINSGVRCVVEVKLKKNSSIIIKMTSEVNRTKKLIEQQAEFSESLCNLGISTARKFSYNGKFCNEYEWNGTIFFVIVEEYVGEEAKLKNYEDLYEFGQKIGMIHKKSLEKGLKINYSFLFDKLVEKKVDFDGIWRDIDDSMIETEIINSNRELHNNAINTVSKFWSTLPKTAVHGDLGIMNNFSKTKEGIILFDFDMAGDEVVLGELFTTWFGSAYMIKFKTNCKEDVLLKGWEYFIHGYTKVRNFTKLEKQHYYESAELFESLYCCRYAKSCLKIGNYQEAEIALYDMKKILRTHCNILIR